MSVRYRLVSVLIILCTVLFFEMPQVAKANVELEVLGSALWSGFDASEIVGDHAFVVMNHGLWVFDISDPAEPSKVAELYLGGGEAICIKNGYAIVATKYHGIKVVDISDPLNPSVVTEYPYIDDNCTCMALDGDNLYVGYNSASIEVVDLSSMPALSQLTVFASGGLTRQIAISGDYAYVATYGDLNVVDISTPSAPNVIASYTDPQYVYGVQINGDYAYLNCYYTIEVIDISIPASPAFEFSYDAPNGLSCLTRNGNYLYYGVAPGEIQKLNLSNPALPVYDGSYTGPPMVEEMHFTGGYCCVAWYYTFALYSYGLDGGLTEIGSAGCYDEVNDVDVEGGFAYVANEKDGLQILDLSDPHNPTIVGNYSNDSSFRGIEVIGNLAYIAAGYSGLKIVDVTIPSAPLLVGELPFPFTSTEQVVIRGDSAYLARNTSGITIVDITVPSSPTAVGSFDTPGAAWSLAVEGDFVYVADNTSLQILDLSSSGAPSFEGSLSMSTCYNVTLHGQYAYMSRGSAGLRIVDISNPAAPFLVNNYSTGGSPYAMYMQADTGYVANGGGGVLLLDFADPVNPVVIGRYLTPSGLDNIFYDGEHIYAAEHYGFEILGVATTPVTCCDLPGDFNNDGAVDIGDLTAMVDFMFSGGTGPACWDEADLDNNCAVDISDLTYRVDYMFAGGPAPVCGCAAP